jgi:Mg-chelatase subunit ChlD
MSEDLFQEVKEKIKEKIGAAEKSNGVDEIVCIVDRSGSMSSIREDAQGGLNEFIREQAAVGAANLTIVEFDNEADTVCDRVNINEAEEYVLRPRGGTALLDAMGLVIGNDLKYNAPDGKTIVVIVTDGGENASREWTREQIFDLINERKEAGWEFLFLASNQDAISTGVSYGFAAEDALSFANTSKGFSDATAVATGYVGSLRTMSKGDALAAKKMYAAASDDLSEEGAVEEKDSKA